MKKSQRMTLDEYDKIKKDIADNKVVDEESKLIVLCRDKMIENVNNPVGIFMINNDRYFKYPKPISLDTVGRYAATFALPYVPPTCSPTLVSNKKKSQ